MAQKFASHIITGVDVDPHLKGLTFNVLVPVDGGEIVVSPAPECQKQFETEFDTIMWSAWVRQFAEEMYTVEA